MPPPRGPVLYHHSSRVFGDAGFGPPWSPSSLFLALLLALPPCLAEQQQAWPACLHADADRASLLQVSHTVHREDDPGLPGAPRYDYLLELPPDDVPVGCEVPSPGSGVLLQCAGNTTGLGDVSTFGLPLEHLPRYGGVQLNVNFTVTGLLDERGRACTVNCSSRPNTRLQVELGFGSTETPCAGPNGETPADSNTTVAASFLCFPESSRSDLTVSVLTNQGMSYDLNVWQEPHRADQSSLRTTYGGWRGAATMLVFNVSDGDLSLLERIKLQVLSRGNFAGFRSFEQREFWGPAHFRHLNRLVQEYLGRRESPTEQLPPETSAYFFHESSECISTLIARGGCANPDEVASCFSGSRTGYGREAEPRLAHHVAFLDSAELTLSYGSVPPRQPGRWFVLLTCATHSWTNHSIGELGVGCPETTVELQWSTESGGPRKLRWGFLLMFFTPSVMLIVIAVAQYLINSFATLALRSSELGTHLPPLMPWMVLRVLRLIGSRFFQVVGNPPARFAALLVLLVSVFCTTALQFVVTHWALTLQTADRNVCFYNFQCYYPYGGADLPVNNMLSHVAYFLAGLHIYIVTITTEFRVQLLSEEGVPPIDLSVFHALAIAVMCEGIGSMSYHVCPSVATFQFDTAFMLPIAHMSMCALEDWKWGPEPQQADTGSTGEGAGSAPAPPGGTGDARSPGEERAQENNDSSAPFRYFLYIMNPIWFFNFMGTWYDVDSMAKWIVYCILVGICALWTFCVLGVIRRFLGIDFESMVGMCGQALLQAFLSLVLAALLMLDVVRDAFGGTANIFLLVSAVAVSIVVLSQWIRKDLIYSIASIHSFSGVVRVVLENMPMAAFAVSAAVALEYFAHKTALVSPTATPALSRETNEQCVFAEVFDNHDLWHLLSAIALALWVMALLAMKVRIHLRQSDRLWVSEAYISEVSVEGTRTTRSETVRSFKSFASERKGT